MSKLFDKSEQKIPIIDISSWLVADKEEAREEICKEWNEAFSKVGFAVIIGHGVSDTLIDAIRSEMDTFFSQTIEYKMRFRLGKYGCPEGGYSPVGAELVSLSMDGTNHVPVDPIEAVSFTSDPSIYKLRDIDISSPFPHAQGNEESSKSHPQYLMSLFGIGFGFIQNRDNPTNPILYGQHTDYQGFTILKPDQDDWHEGSQQGGLQVLLEQDQEWINVKIPKHLNGLVVNAADLIQRWTNGLWHSPVHRVLACVDNDEEKKQNSSSLSSSRKSIVFFSSPQDDSIITPLNEVSPIIREMTGKDPKYDAIKSLDHLWLKINRTN